LNRGVNLAEIRRQFGDEALSQFSESLAEMRELGLLAQCGDNLRLTDRGRLLSNEVFERFVTSPGAAEAALPSPRGDTQVQIRGNTH
jgi:oxygen-independent coproporphyrinogen-3 oxidase